MARHIQIKNKISKDIRWWGKGEKLLKDKGDMVYSVVLWALESPEFASEFLVWQNGGRQESNYVIPIQNWEQLVYKGSSFLVTGAWRMNLRSKRLRIKTGVIVVTFSWIDKTNQL